MTPKQLPPQWETSPLSEIVEIIRGITYKKAQSATSPEEGLLPVLRANNIQNGKIVISELVYVPKDLIKTHQKLKAGDIVVAMSSGSKSVVGKTAKVESDFDGSFGAFCGVLRTAPECSANYVSWFTHSLNYRNRISSLSAGANINNLKPSHFDEIAVPIAPLAEQEVIADKLDTLLSQAENTKSRLERIPQILKRFRQSVLAAAVSGRLTEDFSPDDKDYYQTIKIEIAADKKLAKILPPSKDEMDLARELFEHPDWARWELYALEQLVESARGIPYGIVQTGNAQAEGISTIRCGDVKPLHVQTGSLKKVLPSIEEKYARTRLKGGEVILAIRGTVGNAAAITEKLASQTINISREVAMVPVRESISPEYVALLLQSPGGYRALAEKTKGVAQRGINLADVKRLVTPLPTKSEQAEIVRRVDQLFARADWIEQQVDKALARVSNLSQSILAKAFRGELTEQWRKKNIELISGEKSAEGLLERIKAERARSASLKGKR